jgi:hypothetical protein
LDPRLEFAAATQSPEDGLLQSLRFPWRYRGLSAWFIAICCILSAPLVFAQEPSSSPSSYPSMTSQSSVSTPVELPAVVPGNGASPEQLRLAYQQGRADIAVLDWVLANSGEIKGDTRAGEMRIAFTITPAEGWWDNAGDGKLAWHDAPVDNVHLRIFVLDLMDGRLVPGLSLRATLIDPNGNEQSAPSDFGWYPLINAYGGNVPMDVDSSYTLRVTVEAQSKGPLLPQHHAVSAGDRFQHTTLAEFPPVQITQDAVSQMALATTTASANEAALLKPCNAALSAAITAIWQQSVSGYEKPAGDYFVGYALDYSGRTVQIAGSKLRIKNLVEFTGKDNMRLSVLPRDSRTGRLIPGLKLQASLIAADGKLYGPGELPVLWNPWLTQYGRDSRIPRKGFYKLRVHLDSPGFRRWGRQSERFAAPADVEFDDVSLQPGQKE